MVDCLVLPSLTEGVSRASLEALYLGVPCVMRNVDGNSELIKEGENGVLFDSDEQLSSAMIKCATIGKRWTLKRPNLLPEPFSLDASITSFMNC